METKQPQHLSQRQVWAQCDCCQAEFSLSLELLGQTVQCGRCRNYFVVVPASWSGNSPDADKAASRIPWVRCRSAFHILSRAWLEDWRGVICYVRYPLRWAETVYFLLVLALLMGWAYVLLFSCAVLLVVVRAGNPQAVPIVSVFIVALVVGLYPLYLWHKSSVPRFRTTVHTMGKFVRQRPWLVLRPTSFWVIVFGGWWIIEDAAAQVLARMYRPHGLLRWLTRRRWRVQVPTWNCDLLVEETFWLPGLVRWLLLLPMGLLRLVFFLMPFALRPFRGTFQVRLAGSSYVLAQSRTELSWSDTTVLTFSPGAEQLLDERLMLALAALLHGDG
ncbi:MAG: hypothetical protein RMJ19_03905 [Gemmatales bacterium]|nr:hypothetical protein [Gemmatales bacterium]MDW8174790.1 hypothetical protein [Gemmatales bacterium]